MAETFLQQPVNTLSGREALALDHASIIAGVLEGVRQAREEHLLARCVYRAAERREARNQYCLFLKPWTTSLGTNLGVIMNLVVEKIVSNDLRIDEVCVLSGSLLKEHRVMEAHYGRLNRVAMNATSNLNVPMLREFRQHFHADPEKVVVLGGFEFLTRFPEVSPLALEMLWENIVQHRLGSGIFCGEVKVRNESVFLVNGFAPSLMQMYTHPDSTIVVFSLLGALPWSRARNRFVGVADPAQADLGSLRNELFSRRKELRLAELRLGANGVHLSAGPVEAVVELTRFMSAASRTPAEVRTSSDFQFGRRLERYFEPREVQAILQNPTIQGSGKRTSIFDLTEELDEDAALDLLKSVREQIMK